MRDRRLRIGVLRRSRMPPVTPVPPGAQPRRGNPQLMRNLAQRPAAAHQQPNRLPLEFHPCIDDALYPSNTFLLPKELIRGVHHFEGGSGTFSNARALDVVSAAAVGQEPVVADAMEAFRQDVHQEAADELV